MNEPCRFCGSTRFGHTNVTLDGSRVPACCWDCALCAQHMPALGHAIARFVRRATVADLVEQIRQIHDGDCSWWEDAACDCSIRGHLTALSRLARLAGGGA